MQPWRLTVIEKNEDIQRIKEATELAASRNKVHFYGWENPKILVLVSNDERNEDGCQYASTAAENIMLAAISFGVGSVWINPLMKLRKISPVKEVLDDFGVPDNHVIWATIALGYPVSDGVMLQKNDKVIHFVR